MHLVYVALLVAFGVWNVAAGKITNARINQIITQKCPSGELFCVFVVSIRPLAQV